MAKISSHLNYPLPKLTPLLQVSEECYLIEEDESEEAEDIEVSNFLSYCISSI